MKRLRNIHPGEILKEEFLHPMGISAYRLAQETGLSQTHIQNVPDQPGTVCLPAR